MALGKTQTTSTFAKQNGTEHFNSDVVDHLETLYRAGKENPDVYLPGEYYGNKAFRDNANQAERFANQVTFKNPEDNQVSSGVETKTGQKKPVTDYKQKTTMSKNGIEYARSQLKDMALLERKDWVESTLESYDYPEGTFDDLLPKFTKQDLIKSMGTDDDFTSKMEKSIVRAKPKTTGLGKISLPPLPQSVYDEARIKDKARESKFYADQKLMSEKKLNDLGRALQDIDKFGKDLTKFPGGANGEMATNARAQLMRWGPDLASLPGEGSAFDKFKDYLKSSKSSSNELVKYNPKEATIDVGSELVKPKVAGLGKAVGAFSKVAGGLVKGLAQAPAYELLNPPSAGPSDPEDPVYLFERGLISEEEFLRRMSK